jgi:hypothetical protein
VLKVCGTRTSPLSAVTTKNPIGENWPAVEVLGERDDNDSIGRSG